MVLLAFFLFFSFLFLGFSAAHLPRFELSNGAVAPQVDVGVAAGLLPTYEVFEKKRKKKETSAENFLKAMCDFYSVPVSRLFVQFVHDAVNAGQLMLDLTECPGE